ncbi:L,D-transpeptidase family protein [Parerythrobacter jejuensis]|uniref:L,D-transpeptidase family protein n=1 Tax=Parerythrobacter jejuensis TaxID=795812 RepID=A0A845AMI8_9SPHN|nr:L,D-transpeptidase family protein [Parerythrobacter jejuensis]MXP31480.1 L,D-transpeptidase family protein [Parerythrobacter jejuensis]
MNTMLKWIGGATAATVFVFGGATLASTMMADDEAAPTEKVALEEAIPVDPAKMTGETVQTAAGEDGQAASQQAQTQQANAQADEEFTVKRILEINGPIKYGEWHWNTDDVPADGKIVMTVDLDARVISVFKGGYEIGAAAVLLGTDEHPTPLGTFPIRYKMRHNVSEKYDNAPMPYSMFLTSDGVALHGSDVQNGYASHGCIGMPDDFAAKVFAVAKKGDKVIITRGESLGMGEQIL